MNKEIKKIIENNEFVNNNRREIERIIEDNSDFRKSLLNKVVYCIILLILSFIFMIYICSKSGGKLFILGFIGIIISLIIMLIINSKYKLGFKENVVKSVIKKYNSNLNYYPEQGFSMEEYLLCRFNERCDIFFSEDLITNESNGFKYADILVESEYTDSDGRTHTRIEYKGALARIDIKNCKSEIFLGSVRRNNIFSRNSYQKVQLENDEFNKLFSACTNNELVSYKLLTPDVMEQFVHLKKNTYGDIDIRIIDDKLYVRFSSGDGFVPNLLSQKKEMNSIISSIAILEEVIKVMNNVHDIIEKKAM